MMTTNKISIDYTQKEIRREAMHSTTKKQQNKTKSSKRKKREKKLYRKQLTKLAIVRPSLPAIKVNVNVNVLNSHQIM